MAEWYSREGWGGGGSRVFVGLYAQYDVLVGAAPRLLAQQQTGGQAGRLAHDRHVVRSPRLAVPVHYPEAPAGGAVPDALLGPDGERTRRVKNTDGKTTTGKKTKAWVY